ncbi:MAG: hypothetical protein AMXMBFR47_27710 [Planctomycetota bacterium]
MRRPFSRTASLLAAISLTALLAGCAASQSSAGWPAELVAAAEPLLALDPDTDWTESYNRLLSFGAASVDYVVSRPAMVERQAPDSLDALAATSLAQLLIGRGAPPLSGTCFETSYDLLHFDVKSRGTPLGEARISPGARPRSWPALYPGRFDHTAAVRIDVDGDRQRLREWWLERRERGEAEAAGRRLSPSVGGALELLGRRYVDRWGYAPDRSVLRQVAWEGGKVGRWEGSEAGGAPGDEASVAWLPGVRSSGAQPAQDTPAMILEPTEDYNLVRAACLWLAGRPDAEERLIERVASLSEIVAHNARFALLHSPNPSIRAAVERYNRTPR